MSRITRLRIQNLRAIESLDLELDGQFTALIGENGAGKSSIIEALELLRKAAEPNFLSSFYSLHRGMPGLLRSGAPNLTLGVRVEDDNCKLDYEFVLRGQGAGVVIESETLTDLRREGLIIRRLNEAHYVK